MIQSRTARVELARQRFFDEGQAPTGVVGEAVFESWARCLRRLGSPREPAIFEPVTASRTQLALMKNRHLREAWMGELPRLESMLGTTNCAAMLTDATGVLIGASCVGRSHEELMPVATRLGVNLSEDAVGTTAPGVTARTGKPVSVLGGEHFFDSVQNMHCAAAPIHDIHGRLAGVLDLSSEHIPFEFNALAVAGFYAGAIENRLLVAQSTEHLVIRFQVAPELLDSAMAALVGVGADGKQAWQNGAAQGLLGITGRAGSADLRAAEVRLGLPWSHLAALPTTGAAPLTLPNGLRVWARAEMRARDGRRSLVSAARGPDDGCAEKAIDPMQAINIKQVRLSIKHVAESVSTPVDMPPSGDRPASTPGLREADLDLIQRTLQACGGNVRDTAKRLGVSRGLIYRRLRATAPSDRPCAT